MGGIHVQPPSWKSFPVTGRQLHYLVSNGYMDYPQIPLEEIKAKSKADGLGRLITILQTLYFMVTFFARVEQGLAVSTLELTVVGFVFCMLATSVCWWYKPSDVTTSHLYDLKSPATIEIILNEAGDAAGEPYRSTPLDFADPQEWNVVNIWIYYTNILRHMGLFPEQHPERPIQKFASLNWPRPRSPVGLLIVLFVGLAYVSTFLGAWNFGFPSRIEATAWRIVTLIQCIITLIAGSVELYFFLATAEAHTMPTSKDSGEKAPSDLRGFWNRPCNNSTGRWHGYDVPLKSLVITTPLCALYVICRWLLLVEDLIGLRGLPQSAFKDVDWTRYLPSF